MAHVSDEDRQAALTATRLTGWSGVAKRLERGWVPEPGTSEAQLIELFAAHRLAAIEATGVVELRSAIGDAIDWLKSAPLESGWCCCGDKVEAHNIGSGHSPVDELGYSAMRLQERLQLTLTQLAKGSE